MSPLEKRVAAAQATLDHFKDQPFEWGKRDCAILAAYLLRHLGKPTPLRSFGNYRTAFGAKKALLKRGYKNLEAVLDSIGLERIPYASALTGDIIGLEGDGGLALTIALGNGRVLGFFSPREGDEPSALVLQPLTVITAWRSL